MAPRVAPGAVGVPGFARSRPTIHNMSMEARLEEIAARHAALEASLADPAVLSDRSRYTEMAKAHAEIDATVRTFRQMQEAERDVASARELLRETSDADEAAYL